MEGYFAALKSLEEKDQSVPSIFFLEGWPTAGISKDVLVGKNMIHMANLIEKIGSRELVRLLNEDLAEISADQIVKDIASNIGRCCGSTLDFQELKRGHPDFDVTKADIWTVSRLEKELLFNDFD